MKPQAFAYHRPASLDEALAVLAECGPGAKVIAGGQSLGPMMNMRLALPSDVIDLNDLTELAYVRDRGAYLEIGALTRHYQIEHSALVGASCPLLHRAAATIGHYAIRQRGTLGGSLAHADPVAQLALVAVTLGATVNVASASGRRSLPASAFFLSVMATALAFDEVIESVHFPKRRPGEGAGFDLFSRRQGDYAIVSSAVTIALEDGVATGLRLGIAGVAAVPRTFEALLEPFAGRVPDQTWVAELAAAARAAVAPEDDLRIPAVFRKELTETLVARAAGVAIKEARA